MDHSKGDSRHNNKYSSFFSVEEKVILKVESCITDNFVSSFKCISCNETFPDEFSLHTHVSTHFDHVSVKGEVKNPDSDIDDQAAEEENSDYLSKLKGEGEFTCEKCFESFPRQNLLKVHSHKVHGEDAFECPICGKMFPLRKYVIRHKKKEHIVDGAYKCETCGFSIKKYNNFLRHLKLHTGTKDYTCECCGKSFTTPTVLRRHLRRHTGEKPYSCEECGERFSRLYGLNVHKNKHVGRNFKCSEENCSKAFFSKSALNNHLKSHLPHRPFTCVACGSGFYMSSHYKDHIRMHAGEKPFVCDICNKAFGRKTELVVHHRTHTGERPFKCPQCKKSYIQKGGLKQHLLTHSRGKASKCSECKKVYSDRFALRKHKKSMHDLSEESSSDSSFLVEEEGENE